MKISALKVIDRFKSIYHTAVAYFTIAKRKVMGAIQRRRGPNVVGYIGLLQPLADGLKLFVKKTFKKILYLSPISYCLILATVVVSFYWGCYILTIYSIVTLFYMSFFSNLLPCERSEALRLQKQVDSADYDKIITNIPFVVTVLLICGIGVYCGFLAAKLYLFTLVAMMITRFLGYKITTFFPFGVKLIKGIKKDMILLKYHWYNHFKYLRNINHINLISLGSSLVLGSLFAGSICSEDVFNLNYVLWHYLLGSHCIFVVSIDVYILFFMNMQSSSALASTCVRCFVGANGILYCNYSLAESGVGPQTAVVNAVRPFLNTPQAHDCESVKVFKAMKTAFPLIDEKTYLLERPNTVLPSWLGGASKKVHEVHKTAIWDLAGKQDITELSRLSIKDQRLLRVEDLVYCSKNNK